MRGHSVHRLSTLIDGLNLTYYHIPLQMAYQLKFLDRWFLTTWTPFSFWRTIFSMKCSQHTEVFKQATLIDNHLDAKETYSSSRKIRVNNFPVYKLLTKIIGHKNIFSKISKYTNVTTKQPPQIIKQFLYQSGSKLSCCANISALIKTTGPTSSVAVQQCHCWELKWSYLHEQQPIYQNREKKPDLPVLSSWTLS